MNRSRTAFAALAVAALLAAPPAAPPASAVDLGHVLREVAASNPTLAARRDMVAAARARVPQAGAAITMSVCSTPRPPTCATSAPGI